MQSTQMPKEAQDSREELVVYLVFSPEWGPGYRVYNDEDIQVSGGIHGIERVLEQESYWFARLGRISGELGAHGVTFHDTDIAQLWIAAWEFLKMQLASFPMYEGDRLQSKNGAPLPLWKLVFVFPIHQERPAQHFAVPFRPG